MPKAILDELKHKTGRPSQQKDFWAHPCPGSIVGYLGAQPIFSKPDAKKIFKSIKWKSDDIPHNIWATDNCGYCGAHVEDEKAGWRPVTEEEYDLLISNNPEVQ